LTRQIRNLSYLGIVVLSLLFGSVSNARGSTRARHSPSVSLSSTSLNFGTVNVGSTSSVQYVTVTNAGKGSLSFPSAFSITGDFGFAGLGTCSTSATVAPGASCTVSLSFTPTASGTRTGTLTLTSNAANSPQTIALTGTGASTAPAAPVAPVAISISPTSVALQVSQTQQFSATVSGSTNTAVNWQVNGVTGGNSTVGTISTAGLYTAPSSVPTGGSVTVTAISAADTTKTASASISIAAAAAPVSVTISPTTVSLSGSQTKQFTATVSGTTNTGITWQVNSVTGGSSSTGTISTSGLYTAPVLSSSTSVTITARSTYDTTQSANATATIAASATNSGNQPSSGPALYVATTGSNSNNCSSTAPCATIAYASTLATPGTTINVAPGAYTGDITLTTGGTATAPITFACTGYVQGTTWPCKITGDGSSASSSVWDIETGVEYVIIKGFEITGTSDAHGIFMGWSGSGSNTGYNTIEYNYIHNIASTANCSSDGGAAIDTGQQTSTGHNQIIGNIINTIGGGANTSCQTVQGIYDSTQYDVVENNVVGNVAYGGIQNEHGGGNDTWVNNTVYNCAWGFIIGDSEGNTTTGMYVANNISVNNLKGGFVEQPLLSSGGASYTNNNAYGNPTNFQLGSSGATPTGTVTSNPNFTNYQANGSGTYTLQAGSPAIDAGTSTNAPTTDVRGQAQTTPPTIGAYSYPL